MALIPVAPILAGDLLTRLDEKLIGLLSGLDNAQWLLPTACRAWSVKDIAAHLLDGNLRRLSLDRDGQAPPEAAEPVQDYRGMVAHLNRLNAEWIAAAWRLSPELLVELLRITGRQVADHLRSLDPFAQARFAVAWAGDEVSPVWFDVAREYTEKWHHQQQIREAVGAPGLLSREYLHPVLDTFLRALPHTFRDVRAPEGSAVSVRIIGEAGGDWTVLRQNETWALFAGAPDSAAATVRISADSAWRLFTKGIEAGHAERMIRVEGDPSLGRRVLRTVSVMA